MISRSPSPAAIWSWRGRANMLSSLSCCSVRSVLCALSRSSDAPLDDVEPWSMGMRVPIGQR